MQFRENSLLVWLNSGRICRYDKCQIYAALPHPPSSSQTDMANGSRCSLQLSPNVSSEALQGWLHEEKTQSRLHICKAREHMRAEPRVSSKKTAGNLLLCIDQQVVRARE